MDQKLVAYLVMNKQQGYSFEELQTILKNYGISDEELHVAIEEAKQQLEQKKNMQEQAQDQTQAQKYEEQQKANQKNEKSIQYVQKKQEGAITNPYALWLVCIATGTLYYWYWLYQLGKEYSMYSSLLAIPLVNAKQVFSLAKEIAKNSRYSPLEVFFLLYLMPFAAPLLLQRALKND
ncbi:MAG: hypothetical protein QW594_02325 [Candidatus Woesearchaeota archaeon]